jgi:Tol biopolymer transport system component
MPLVRVALLIGLVGVSLSAQQSLSVELQRVTQQLTVSGDMRAAIDGYKRIVDKAGSNREVAAQALLRLAESYEKLKDAEAATIYARIVREFPERKEATTARARLGGTGGTPPAASAKNDRAVWTGPNVDMTGRVSGDGRLISFVDQGTGRLMIRDVAANADRALTATAPNRQRPQWSAVSKDGKQIVYEWVGTRPEVHVAALTAGGLLEPRRLVVANAVSFSSFDWSPDGKWIAAALELTDGTGQIGVIAVADGSFRSLKSVGRGVVGKVTNPSSIFFSPDGKYVAYDRPPTGTSQQRDVFVLAVDGNRDVPAVAYGNNDFVMGWSADGSRLLFRSDRTGSWGLWAQPFADGTAQGTPELLKTDIGRSVSLGVTASGTLYLYKRISTRDLTIASIDLDSGKLLGPPVGFPEGFVEGAQNAAWSPDGKYLAYLVTCNNGCLAIRSVATGQVRRLAPTMSNLGVPSWSPDGRSLLASGRDVAGREGILRIDAQSGEASAVITGEGLQVVSGGWSPDGSKVYFNRIDGVAERDIASGSERMVHREAGGLRLAHLSPDRRHVFGIGAFDPSTQSAGFVVVPVAGGQPRELFRVSASEGFSPGPFQWTPDSRAILAIQNVGSRKELWLVPAAGGPHRKLDIDPNIWFAGTTGGRDNGFSLSPDGRSIAFQTGNAAAEVWALEHFLPTKGTTRR